MQQLGLPGITLADAARFDAFWPGPNAAALSAARRVASMADEPMLFLHGPQGAGKTHLLKAAWRDAHEHGLRTGYLPLDQALMLDPSLIDGWAALQLVVLDSIDAVVGFDAWERALFRLVEEQRERGGRVFAGARRPPDQLGLNLADLASRLAWGPIYALLPLDDAELAALAMHRAAARGLELPERVARFLVRRLARDPSALVAAVARLDEAALAAQRRLTVPFVRAVLFGDG